MLINAASASEPTISLCAMVLSLMPEMAAMRFAFQSARTKVVAKVTLGLWLLGFVVGVANACLLETGRDHEGQSSAATLIEADVSDDCIAGVGEQACKSLRDLEQGTVVKAKVQQGADSATVLDVIASWRLFAVAPLPAVWHWPASTALPPGPPVAILFLRLTL